MSSSCVWDLEAMVHFPPNVPPVPVPQYAHGTSSCILYCSLHIRKPSQCQLHMSEKMANLLLNNNHSVKTLEVISLDLHPHVTSLFLNDVIDASHQQQWRSVQEHQWLSSNVTDRATEAHWSSKFQFYDKFPPIIDRIRRKLMTQEFSKLIPNSRVQFELPSVPKFLPQ